MFSPAVHGRFRPKPDWLVFGLLAEAGLLSAGDRKYATRKAGFDTALAV